MAQPFDYRFVSKIYDNVTSDVSRGITRENLDTKYSEFRMKYPKIWAYILSGNFDPKMFKKMCDVYEKSFESTQGGYTDKKLKSDFEVGNLLAEKYIYGKVAPQPSRKDLRAAYRKVKRQVEKRSTEKK